MSLATRAARIVGSFARAMFQIDPRALAAMRVCLGLLFAYDAIDRARFADVFYTDLGVIPRNLALAQTNGLHPSLHMLSGDADVQIALFAVAAAAAFCFAAGYRTKLAGVFTLVLAISAANRNTAIYHTADQYARVLLIWLLFLPCDRVWSLASKVRTESPATKGTPVLSFATVGLMLQVLVVYGVSEYFKSGNIEVWFYKGSMLSYVLQSDQYTSSWGIALRDYPTLLTFLSRAAFVLEGAGPALALLAFRWPRIRLAMVFSFIAFHLGTALLMRVGLFPFASMIAWLAFVPTIVWDRLQALGPRLRQLFPARLALQMGATSTQAPPPTRPRHVFLRLGAQLPAAVLVFGLLWSASYSTKLTEEAPPDKLTSAATMIGFTQSWSMFAGPGTDDGWLVIEGTFANGETRDLLTNQPVTWARPAVISETMPNDRWRTYLFRLWTTEYGDHRRYFGNYLCRAYKTEPQLISYRITFVHTRTLVVDGQVVGEHPPEAEVRLESKCPHKLNPRLFRQLSSRSETRPRSRVEHQAADRQNP